MKNNSTKIGVFLSEPDMLFLKKHPRTEIVYLVAKNTPEESWALSFLNPKAYIVYDLKQKGLSWEDCTYPYILNHSNLGTLLKLHQIKHLWMTINEDVISALEKWCRANLVHLIGTPGSVQKKYENKIWFDKFLKVNNISKPLGSNYDLKSIPDYLLTNSVIQEAHTIGGEGTYFIKQHAQITDLIMNNQLKLGRKYLVRKWLSGETYGITIFVTSGIVALSGLRLQCFGKKDNNSKRPFLGIQWVPASQLSRPIKEEVNKAMKQLGKALYKDNFFGFANVDFLITDAGQVVPIECNPRISAATSQLIKNPELISGIDCGNLIILNSLTSKSFAKKWIFYPLPKGNYAGAVMDIDSPANQPKIITRRIQLNGVYKIKSNDHLSYFGPDIRSIRNTAKQLAFISQAQTGERVKPGTTVGCVISDLPLFDHDGHMNKIGQIVNKFFSFEYASIKPKTS